jgi:2-keto-4-pentenoate hydratase/2-oxohepta-3-ene-1,7-dioic acid hydratase in catechol pathway
VPPPVRPADGGGAAGTTLVTMRIARFATDEGMSFGVVEENTVAAVAAHPFGELAFTGQRFPLADVRLLAPILPSKIIAIGRNYAEHARELGNEVPEEPIIFAKPSTAVIGPGEAVSYPEKLSERVDYEGELAVVIGRMCREVPAARAAEVILGYTCANDVTARDLQRKDGQWTRAKGFDTFCPIGPWIETEADPSDLAITTTVNGETRQDSRTSLLLHAVPALVEYVSQVMTLLPGDVILTGTPEGVGPLEIGDEVTVTVENVGALTNRVVARE